MIKEAIGYGASVEEATEDAKLKLGVKDDDDIQIDVISMPKKKVMGIFGGSDAEVKVSVERPDEIVKKQPHEKKQNREKAANTHTKKTEKTAPQKAAQPAVETVPADSLPNDSRALVAVNYIRQILAHLDCTDTDIRVAENDDGALIVLDGADLGVIIGRRGETLDALQHLASLAARDESGYYKVTLNIGNYREKRADALASLAKRVAKEVLKTGRGKALEPMNPYERRLIHTAIQEIEGVTSASVGEGEARRVVVVLEGHDVHEVRFSRPHRDGDRRGGYSRRDRDRRPSQRVNAAPTRAPRSDADLPLYGKIEKKSEE